MSTVTFFEIPVTDLVRAVDFYSRVLGIELTRTGIDGNAMALFPEPDDGGAAGALAQGDSYTPSLHGPRVYFRVPDIDDTLVRVHQRGGTTLYPRTSIGDLGHVAEFEDSEGNRIALLST